MRYTIILAALMVLLMTPQAARADNGIIISRTDLHAGPGGSYPRLVTLRANTGVNLLGCVFNWNWCEVAVGGTHGWVSAEQLGLRYHGHTRGVRGYGPRLGIPVIAFNEPVYWDKYYYDRDFYTQRYGKHHDNRWSKRDCDYRDRSGQCRAWERHQNERNHDWSNDRDDNRWHDSHERDANDYHDGYHYGYQQYNDNRYHSHYNN